VASKDALLARWREEERLPREGWDFSHLAGRLTEERPPWGFDAECRGALGSAARVLDMGTGGGEWLRSLAGSLPPDTVATEGFEPNFPVAQANLAKLGILVLRYDAEAEPAMPMPFDDGRFDLVLNRHEGFDPKEVARVLGPGGAFLTQQVAGDDFVEAHRLFGAELRYPGHLLGPVVGQLTEAGLRVEESAEWKGMSSFHDVGALVYYFKLVSWYVPEGFCVDDYAEELLRLHADGPGRGQPLTFSSSRFWLRATKPA
jgi:SAM-dependent methyltransferase